VWCLRLLLLAPFAFIAPEVAAAIAGRPDAVGHLSASVALVMGNGAFIAFAVMLAVTPLATLTDWRWHVVLRRDYGIAMFVIALTDLIIAATVTGNTFPGGFLSRVTGHSFLAMGTLATLLCVPLVLTANRSAQRALGRYWKPLHRLTYVVWGAILVHLLLLFGFRGPAIHALEVTVPLVVLRLPPVRRWYVVGRRGGTARPARAAVGVAAAALFVVGMAPFVHSFAVSGKQAFVERPLDD
jgi:sulfoxide reductase heme-binding subunit YedZ